MTDPELEDGILITPNMLQALADSGMALILLRAEYVRVVKADE